MKKEPIYGKEKYLSPVTEMVLIQTEGTLLNPSASIPDINEQDLNWTSAFDFDALI